MSCPTVKIKCDNEQGFYIINESDFDSKKHDKFTEKTTTKKQTTKKKAN